MNRIISYALCIMFMFSCSQKQSIKAKKPITVPVAESQKAAKAVKSVAENLELNELWADIFTERHVRSPYLPAFFDNTYASKNIDFESDLKVIEIAAKNRQLTLEEKWQKLEKRTSQKLAVLTYIFEQKPVTFIEKLIPKLSKELQYEAARLLISECYFEQGLHLLMHLHSQLDNKDTLKSKIYNFLTEYSSLENDTYNDYTNIREPFKLLNFLKVHQKPQKEIEEEVEEFEPPEIGISSQNFDDSLSDEGTVISESRNSRSLDLTDFTIQYGAYFLEEDAGNYWSTAKSNSVKLKTKFRGEIEFTLYRVARTETFTSLHPSDLKSLDLYSKWTQKADSSTHNNCKGFSTELVKFPKLTEGKYLLAARLKFCPFVLLKRIIVSNEILYSRKNKQSVDAIVLNRRNLKPVKNKKLQIISYAENIKTSISGETDPNGIFSVDNKMKTDNILVNSLSAPLVLETVNNVYIPFENDIVDIWTSAPQYKPSETVHFRGNLRRKGSTQSVPVDSKTARVQIFNSRNKEVFSKNLNLSKTGSFYDELKLKASAKTGKYTFMVNGSKCGRFHVKSYRLPRFKIDIQNQSEFWKLGSEYKNTLTLSHMNGTPIAGEKVEVAIKGINKTPNILKLTTDEFGKASFNLSESTLGNKTRCFINFSYTSPDGQIIEEKISLFRAEKYLSLHLSQSHYSGVSIYRANFLRNYEFIKPDRTEYTLLDSKGKVIRKVSSSNKELIVYQNSKIQKIVCSATYKNYTERYSLFHQPELLKSNKLLAVSCPPVLKDKQNFNLQIDWDPPKEKSIQVFIFAENTQTHFRKSVILQPGQNLIAVQAQKEWGPNVYFHAVCFDIDNVNKILDESCSAIFERDDLYEIKLSTDKTTYKPGQQCKVDISCFDRKGRAISGVELSLSVLNESLFSSTKPYSILDTFNEYEYKNNTKTSFGSTHAFYKTKKWYLGAAPGLNPILRNYRNAFQGRARSVSYFGGSKSGGSVYQRSKFNEIALWEPLLTSDKDGKVSLTFKMPDTITNWVFDVKAISPKGQAVEKTFEANSTQTLETDIILPRIIRSGDIIGLPLQIINRSETSRALLSASIAHDGKIIAKTNNEKVFLKENSLLSQFLNVEVPVSGHLDLKSFISTRTDNDAVSRKMRISPFGYKNEETHYIGSIRPEKIQLPSQGVLPDSMTVNIHLETDLSSKIRSALDKLISYRYGCAEQTISRFTPLIVVNHSLEKIGIESPYKNKMPKIIDDGLARLYRFQHSDGGWMWYETGESNYRVSTLVLEGLIEAAAQGIDVDEQVIRYGAEFVLSQLSQSNGAQRDSVIGSGDRTSYLALAVLSKYAKLFNDSKFLEAVEKRLPDLAKDFTITQEGIYLCKAYLNIGKNEEALKLFSSLNPWNQDYKTRQKAMLAGTALEICDSLNLNCDPREIISKLTSSRSDGWWFDTRATHLVIRGLAAHISSQSEKSRVGVFLNGKKISELNSKKINLTLRGKQFTGGRLMFQNMNGAIYNAVVSVSSYGSSKINLKNPDARLSFKLKDNKQNSYLSDASLQLNKFYTYELKVETKLGLNYSRISIPRPAGVELLGNPKLPTGIVSFEEYDDSFNFFVETLPAGEYIIKLLFKADLPGKVFAPLPELDSMYGTKLRVNSYGPERWTIKK